MCVCVRKVNGSRAFGKSDTAKPIYRFFPPLLINLNPVGRGFGRHCPALLAAHSRGICAFEVLAVSTIHPQHDSSQVRDINVFSLFLFLF